MKNKRPAKRDVTYYDLLQGYVDKGYELKNYGFIEAGNKGLHAQYCLYKIVINPSGQKSLLITTGFHGEEFNAPISFLQIIDKVVAFAEKNGVRVILYICVNPVGFDLHQRYSPIDIDKLKSGNNDFLRYKIAKDKWVCCLKTGEEILDYKIIESGAKEVRLLKADMLKYPVPDGILDFHQQKGNLTTGNLFAYIFDRRDTYRQIMNKLEKITPIARNEPWKDIQDGREIHYRIDEDGFVFVHDGSITDMFYRLGSRFAVCAETNADLPLTKVSQINLIWVKELIKLIAK
jgi:hypothetical protein